MTDLLAPGSTFAELVDLERVDTNVFRSTFESAGLKALYGGQVAAQALAAAGSTVDDARLPHSLQCRYLRPGDETRPVVFRVDRDLDGRRFSARRVTAWQAGKAILTASASFHAASTVTSSDRDDLPRPTDGVERASRFPALVHTQEPVPTERTPPGRLWVGFHAPVAPDPLARACAQAFVSDLTTPDSPGWDDHVEPGPSLDHVMWFHDLQSPQDRWLVETELEAATSERYTYRGRMWSESGRRVATFAQEALYVEHQHQH
ncbi:acyl-CoA thioesterase [Aeromicrobium sp. Root495]|uniref:acyl-CoA thioesterase n=1 Tax=Aeromicrobium sp. Root495 TaxID=1736550 RepID=UPI00138F2E28|nr:acyl-CoA thioesterase domain-containing protein [Aeromicrobium sp. Root495]